MNVRYRDHDITGENSVNVRYRNHDIIEETEIRVSTKKMTLRRRDRLCK